MTLNIAKILKSKKLTQVAFANSVGISPGYLSEIISGKKDPSQETLRAFARELDLSIGDLYSGGAPRQSTPLVGFQSPVAEPYTAKQSTPQPQKNNSRRPLFITLRPAIEFGICVGDILTIDLTAKPTLNDIVLATSVNNLGEGTTELFRFASPWLIPATTGAQPVEIDNSGNIAINGVIVEIYRSLVSAPPEGE